MPCKVLHGSQNSICLTERALTDPRTEACTEPKMQAARGAGTPSLHLATIVSGVLGAGVAATLVAWRLNLSAWEAAQTSCQVLVFALGCWLLPKDNVSHGPTKQLVTALGVTFAVLRFINYLRVAFWAVDPPQQYGPLFDQTGVAYAIFGLYMVECMFMQVLLNRVMPGWASACVGFLQGLLWACMAFRYTRHRMTRWSMLRTILVPQVGMFAPYMLLTHKRMRRIVAALYKHSPQSPQLPGHPTTSSAGTQEGGASSTATKSRTNAAPIVYGMASAQSTASKVQAGRISAPAAAWPMQAALPEQGASTSIASKVQGVSTAVGLLWGTPYKSRWRTMRTVCIKLDTELPCSSLPTDMAEQLQSALRASIGQATSLSISDVAVCHGCICITMRVMEEAATADADEQAAQASSLQANGVAHALLPELQSMLSAGLGCTAVQRATVQLDDDCVVSIWRQDKQGWDIKAQSRRSVEDDGQKPWLGIAKASEFRVSSPSGSMSAPSTSLDVVVDAQLWCVSKVADVEGWTPPQQHQATADWPSSAHFSYSGSSLKLLVQSGGSYLPTQVIRLLHGATDDYVTAQVLIHLQNHQLIRHHEGGAPCILLPADLELWQNEVLLSSSPLVAMPTARSSTGDLPVLSAWWWGATDKAVQAATDELQLFAEQCTAAAKEEDACTAIHTYVQYVQDLAVWLSHVQRLAHATRICQHTPAAIPDKSQDCWVMQPTLPPQAVKSLGKQLVQYAGIIGLNFIKCMVQQQMQSVVKPAVSRCARNSQHSWLLAGIRAAVLGFPCQHDEQLYKQRLVAMHLSGVLVVSSVASMLIAGAYAARAAPAVVGWPDIFTIILSGSWAIMHLTAAAGTLLRARSMQTSSAETRQVFWAIHLVKWCYLWRAVVWLALALRPTAAFYTLFDTSTSWLPLQSMLAVTEQLQAGATMPAPIMMLVTLAVELPAILLMAPVRVMAVPLVVIARLLLDAYIRTRLVAPRHTVSSQRAVKSHVKTD